MYSTTDVTKLGAVPKRKTDLLEMFKATHTEINERELNARLGYHSTGTRFQSETGSLSISCVEPWSDL